MKIHALFSLRLADGRAAKTNGRVTSWGVRHKCDPNASATEPMELNRQSTCIPGHPVFRVMLHLCTFHGLYVAWDSKWLSEPPTRSRTGPVSPPCRLAGQWLTNVGWLTNNVPFLFTKMWSKLKMVGGQSHCLYSNHRHLVILELLS